MTLSSQDMEIDWNHLKFWLVKLTFRSALAMSYSFAFLWYID